MKVSELVQEFMLVSEDLMSVLADQSGIPLTEEQNEEIDDILQGLEDYRIAYVNESNKLQSMLGDEDVFTPNRSDASERINKAMEKVENGLECSGKPTGIRNILVQMARLQREMYFAILDCL